MLADVQLAATVADSIRAFGWTPLVVDPVMIATSGDRLLSVDAEQVIRDRLLPLATLVTPNLDEASLLTGLEVRDVAQMERAGTVMLDMGAAAVLMKGGHLEGDVIVDLLVTPDGTRQFSHPRIHSTSTHGTGCTLSAAITAGLLSGRTLEASIEAGLDYVVQAIANARRAGRGAWAGESPVQTSAGPDRYRMLTSRVGRPARERRTRRCSPSIRCHRAFDDPSAGRPIPPASCLSSLPLPLPCSLFPVLPRRSDFTAPTPPPNDPGRGAPRPRPRAPLGESRS
jgi:hydroxymethylpyrimidine kinase/phosphomethylpyrimidine kinase